jgi:LytS/YehU family sensor histidine kinase
MGDTVHALLNRLPVALVGMALGWLIYAALSALHARTLPFRIACLAALSLPAAVIFATVNFMVFDILAPLPGEHCAGGPCTFRDGLIAVSDSSINWGFVFAAWGLLYISMASAAQTRAADQRARINSEAARLAEIRALRYQINPHFLFNLLNTLSSLVIRRRLEEAEALIGEIGRFFRYSLAADPVADSALGEEIEMQSRYLELERRRFPHRLNVAVEVADGVDRAQVPTLILQPLVENAIKHGVERSRAAVTLTLRAAEAAGRLVIVVEDDARPEPDDPDRSPPPGLGIGLNNVMQRLRARFGDEASFVAGPLAEGGFRVELRLPLTVERP